MFNNFLFTTHLCCHSSLQGKEVMSFARVQHQWLSCQGHMRLWSSDNCRNSCALAHVHSGSPVLQGECRVGQEWEELGKGKQNLDCQLHFQWSVGGKMNEKWNRKEGRLVSRKYEIVRSSTIMLQKKIGQIIKDPNILLTLTWCHRHPTYTPTRPWSWATS